jgi:hypothetical protein
MIRVESQSLPAAHMPSRRQVPPARHPRGLTRAPPAKRHLDPAGSGEVAVFLTSSSLVTATCCQGTGPLLPQLLPVRS